MENNNNSKLALPSVVTSVRISPEFYRLAKENRISFSEAMRVGISTLLADKGVVEYDNNLNFTRKLRSMSIIIENQAREIEQLRKGGVSNDTRDI